MDVQYRNDIELSRFGVQVPSYATVKLEIDQGELHNMIQFEHDAEVLHKEHKRDRHTREECPAMQQAYEQYQLLLKLAQTEEDEQ